MPAIYLPRGSEGFEFCHPERGEDFETLHLKINGAPQQPNWRSPRMHMVRAEQGRKLAVSGSPWLGSHALIFRRQAVGELEPLLLSYGELLPVDCAETDLVFFNPTRVLDLLDEEASDVRRLPDGSIFRIARYAFKPDVIAGIDVFKLSCLRVSPTYVSERFVEQVRAAKLRGLDFKRVWSQ
jgi:hypothetical protein